MGVPVGDATGEYVTLLECEECDERYETDETTSNNCPECGAARFEVVDGYATDPEYSWREA